MVINLIHEYWDYLVSEIRTRGILDESGLSELAKSDLLNRFLIENNTLINYTKIESSKLRK